MRLGKYVACACIVTALAVVVFMGCGVNSGVRDANTPGYSGGPGGGLPGGGANPGGDVGDAGASESEVFDMVNAERETAGVNPLSWSDALYDLAKAHSNDMCDRGFFSHVNPEGEGPSQRGQKGHAGSYEFTPCVPDPFRGVAENIAMGYSTPAQAMEGWNAVLRHLHGRRRWNASRRRRWRRQGLKPRLRTFAVSEQKETNARVVLATLAHLF
jgi:hypothetical protein